MEKITIEVFPFNELEEKIKEKVIADYRYINVEDDDWYKPIEEAWIEKLAGIGFEDAGIFFSGFYSQGDGASFDATPNLVKLATHLSFPKAVIAELEEAVGMGEISGEIEVLSRHYSHENTRKFYVPGDLDTEFATRLQNEGEKLRYGLCNELYRELEKEYSYLTDDKQVIETIEANEYLFLVSGKLSPVQ